MENGKPSWYSTMKGILEWQRNVTPACEPVGRIPRHAAHVVGDHRRAVRAQINHRVGEGAGSCVACHPIVLSPELLPQGEFDGIEDVAPFISQLEESVKSRGAHGSRPALGELLR